MSKSQHQSGGGGMGSHKHGISGHAGKGPAVRMAIEILVRKEEAARVKRRQVLYSSVSELFRKTAK